MSNKNWLDEQEEKNDTLAEYYMNGKINDLIQKTKEASTKEEKIRILQKIDALYCELSKVDSIYYNLVDHNRAIAMLDRLIEEQQKEEKLKAANKENYNIPDEDESIDVKEYSSDDEVEDPREEDDDLLL